MATKVRPLEDRVIVKRIEEQEQKSAGDIITPPTRPRRSRRKEK
jgi:co-chaperonin GroES (HSP10)